MARAGQTAADKQAAAYAKSGAATVKAAEKTAKETAKAIEREAKETARIRNQINSLELREYQKAEREKTRAAEQEARARSAAEKKALAEQESEHAKAIRNMESRARSFGNIAGRSTSRVLGFVGRAAAIAGTLGGGFSVADSLSKGIAQEATAGVIFRGADKKGEFTDQKQVQQLAQATAISTGGSTEDILGGLDQFVRKTGDLGVAKDLLEQMAKLSAATGTNFADMGNTAAEVYNQLNDSEKTMEVMRALAGQGKAGAIDIKDLGQYGGRLAASAAQFSGPLAGNIESFGAIAQLAKKLGGATDTAEATESVARLASDMAKHESSFDALGVKVFADKNKTKFRNAEDIITESVVKSKGDETVLHELFGERSIKAALGAQVAYSNAGGGKAGEAAIRQQFKELKSTTMSTEDVDQGAKERLAENQAKLNIAMEELHRTMNERLLPKLPALIEQFERAIPTIGRVLDVFINFPAASIGSLIAAAIVADIAKAGIGQAVASVVTGILKGAGSNVGAPSAGGASAGAGLIGKGMAVAGAAAAGYGIGSFIANDVIDPMLKGEERGKTKASLLAGNVESIENALHAGRISPEQAEEQRAKIAGMVSEARAGGATGNAGNAILGSVTGTGPGIGQFKEDRAFSQSSDQVTKELEKLAAAIAEKTGQISSFDSGAGKGPADPNHPSRGALAP